MITSIKEGLGIQGVMSSIEQPESRISNGTTNAKCLFDAVIVDNAHQVEELENFLILNNLRPGKLILIGDC